MPRPRPRVTMSRPCPPRSSAGRRAGWAGLAELHRDHGVDLRLGVGVDGDRGNGRVEASVSTTAPGRGRRGRGRDRGRARTRRGSRGPASARQRRGLRRHCRRARRGGGGRRRPLAQPLVSARRSCGSSTGQRPGAGRRRRRRLLAARRGGLRPGPFVWSDQYDRKIQFPGLRRRRRRSGRRRLHSTSGASRSVRACRLSRRSPRIFHARQGHAVSEDDRGARASFEDALERARAVVEASPRRQHGRGAAAAHDRALRGRDRLGLLLLLGDGCDAARHPALRRQGARGRRRRRRTRGGCARAIRHRAAGPDSLRIAWRAHREAHRDVVAPEALST